MDSILLKKIKIKVADQTYIHKCSFLLMFEEFLKNQNLYLGNKTIVNQYNIYEI